MEKCCGFGSMEPVAWVILELFLRVDYECLMNVMLLTRILRVLQYYKLCCVCREMVIK
jgi:hypothetical protein